MNITDIDDKIIRRARQNHLYDMYVQNNNLEDIIVDARTVLDNLCKTVEDSTDMDKKTMLSKMFHK